MNDFFNSIFIRDLKDGKLPPVRVEIPATTYLGLGFTMVLSALVIIIIWNFSKK